MNKGLQCFGNHSAHREDPSTCFSDYHLNTAANGSHRPCQVWLMLRLWGRRTRVPVHLFIFNFFYSYNQRRRTVRAPECPWVRHWIRVLTAHPSQDKQIGKKDWSIPLSLNQEGRRRWCKFVSLQPCDIDGDSFCCTTRNSWGLDSDRTQTRTGTERTAGLGCDYRPLSFTHFASSSSINVSFYVSKWHELVRKCAAEDKLIRRIWKVWRALSFCP